MKTYDAQGRVKTSPVSPTVSKGDMIVNDGATDVRLQVGSNDQILTADSTQSTGVKWATPSDAAARYGIAQCRLEYNSATQVRLNAYGGQYLDVNGTIETVDGAVAADQLNTTENLINSTGGDSGAAMGASTLYYVYRSSANATTFASQTRASTTAPTAYRGSLYLGSSGNAAEWRLVGMVRTNGSTQFVDSAAQRFVLSYFNRRNIQCSNAFTADRTTTSASVVELNSEIRSEFLTWEDEAVSVSICGAYSYTGNLGWIATGLGVDGTTITQQQDDIANGANDRLGIGISVAVSLSRGYHYVTLLGYVQTAGNTATWYSSDAVSTSKCRTWVMIRG